MFLQLLLLSFILLCSSIANADLYTLGYRSHPTDCTSITDGKPNQICFQENNRYLYKCVPGTDSPDCNTPSEWKLITTDLSNYIKSGDSPTFNQITTTKNIKGTPIERVSNITKPSSYYQYDSIFFPVWPITDGNWNLDRLECRSIDIAPNTEYDVDLMYADDTVYRTTSVLVQHIGTVSGSFSKSSNFTNSVIPINKYLYLRFNSQPDGNQVNFSCDYYGHYL